MSRMMKTMSFLGCAALASACGDSTPTSTMTTGGLTAKVCAARDFSVEITAGPSAGLKVAGHMVFAEDETTGALSGRLRSGESVIPFSGYRAPSGELALNFQTPTGYILGSGEVKGDLCAPTTRVEGVAVGPEIGADNRIDSSDTGHWLYATPNLIFQFNPIVFQDIDLGLGGLGGGGGGTSEIKCYISDSGAPTQKDKEGTCGGAGGTCEKNSACAVCDCGNDSKCVDKIKGSNVNNDCI